MSAAWLKRVLEYGESVQDAPPAWEGGEARTILESAFREHLLDVAGPPVPFDPAVAEWAAQLLADACWRLVSEEPTPAFRPREPDSPAAHLSADVTLRLLPAVYRRAKARTFDHPLVRDLDAVFRGWPLSGVLADLDGSPTGSVEFFGHAGLQVLYAERLAATGRVGWVPLSGVGRDRVEYAFAERNRPVPTVLPETVYE
jgi:hypothetical protein